MSSERHAVPPPHTTAGSWPDKSLPSTEWPITGLPETPATSTLTNIGASLCSLDNGARFGQSARVRKRGVRPLDATALEALTTDRLLAYRKRLLELEDSATASDLDFAERQSLDPSLVYFKDEAKWIDLNAMVKSILDKREHRTR